MVPVYPLKFPPPSQVLSARCGSPGLSKERGGLNIFLVRTHYNLAGKYSNIVGFDKSQTHSGPIRLGALINLS